MEWTAFELSESFHWLFRAAAGTSVGALLILGGGTLVASIVGTRDTRRKVDVRQWLVAQSVSEDPNWRSAVEDLSMTERRMLIDVLEERLRDPTVPDPPKPAVLASILGLLPTFDAVPDQRRERLRALKWAALLNARVDPDALRSYIDDSNETEREAAARVLLANDAPFASRLATDLLLSDGPLSVFGLDLLYHHNRSDTSSLLHAVERRGSMDPVLIIQVMAVISNGAGSTNRLREWITDQLAHDSDRVQAAARYVLERDALIETTRERAADVRDDGSVQVVDSAFWRGNTGEKRTRTTDSNSEFWNLLVQTPQGSK